MRKSSVYVTYWGNKLNKIYYAAGKENIVDGFQTILVLKKPLRGKCEVSI
jgi:hypothetical protein